MMAEQLSHPCLKITGATNPNSICVRIHKACGGTIDFAGYHNRAGHHYELTDVIAFFIDPRRSLVAYEDLCTCTPRPRG